MNPSNQLCVLNIPKSLIEVHPHKLFLLPVVRSYRWRCWLESGGKKWYYWCTLTKEFLIYSKATTTTTTTTIYGVHSFIQPVSQSVCSSFTLSKECEEYSASFRIRLILFLARLHVLAGNATNGSADTQKGTNEISTLPFMMTSYLERVERRGRWW